MSTRPMRRRPQLAKCVGSRHLVLVFSCLDLSAWSLVPEPGPLTLCNKRERSSGTQTQNFSTYFLTWHDDILILLISVKIKPPEALVTLVITDDYVQWGGTSVQSLPSTVQTTDSAQLCCLQPSVRPWSFIIML